MVLRSPAHVVRSARPALLMARPRATLSMASQVFAPLALRSPTPQQNQRRQSSHSPMGAAPINPRKQVTVKTLQSLYKKNEPITMMTAHDFPSAHVAEAAGMEMILVGDSLAMVALGMADTSEIGLEEMILHCRSVSRAVTTAFTIGDMPMGSYEISPEQALQTAIRLVKEGRVQSVKLEGGSDMAPTIKRITQAGIPVVAHIGLTPQRQNALGGFRVQGKSTAEAIKFFHDALAVQDAGAFMVVLEAVPAEVASIVTKKLKIPTIGIGAGNGCSGQVLVQVDMVGNFPPGRFLPKFVKKYGDVWGESLRAIEQYRNEVKSREYPSKEFTYPSVKEDVEEFQKFVDEHH
ncbi:3-methyl-2-oxobutanoate hydroxymethyltransferase [Coccidioides immitis RS]|uniref:3-methyl-2-oxobutanoate hydroxymethyltransferase n=7 Tax=Coccidioides TaxID=5500 RepID=J3KIN0_COCIM|nr:3-methyl-2-oxobutanoate hydroxymethyltransferase [Coccidioides immitis RS]XP_003065969.1 3-methyl-2-oxobutanoate hydroxymethyltransferase, putative [Coccidioides posadasii C735 delta SOWgp]EFW21858.1 3-methyl-2-oxobutanoate hydroxymethyltransferase [Coccidioides posadasii str. Silveira]KMM65316.1 3-methyl-2-oxobutanoate hydroxymethyltransferase [Coccidioides posadasii RMSCC 3488]KMP01127.1 3-methyl-2-oxobutanoate hydroxymethyltransferase [Coccidioides immitis RMSCC 2394]KMU74290.1 3-methyl-|eukprot:XP_003065969.1 3-methyl-2-oxobutanoate hydroxymethyltransferase, putative [Coccidioides posadasii C735 delta SOWgp]